MRGGGTPWLCTLTRCHWTLTRPRSTSALKVEPVPWSTIPSFLIRYCRSGHGAIRWTTNSPVFSANDIVDKRVLMVGRAPANRSRRIGTCKWCDGLAMTQRRTGPCSSSARPPSGPALARAFYQASRQHQWPGLGHGREQVAPDVACDLVGVVEQVERGQRLRRQRIVAAGRPRLADHAQEHRVALFGRGITIVVDVEPIELLLQVWKHLERQVRVQRQCFERPPREIRGDSTPFEPPALEADVLVLAGGIGTGVRGLEAAWAWTRGRPVVYVRPITPRLLG